MGFASLIGTIKLVVALAGQPDFAVVEDSTIIKESQPKIETVVANHERVQIIEDIFLYNASIHEKEKGLTLKYLVNNKLDIHTTKKLIFLGKSKQLYDNGYVQEVPKGLKYFQATVGAGYNISEKVQLNLDVGYIKGVSKVPNMKGMEKGTSLFQIGLKLKF